MTVYPDTVMPIVEAFGFAVEKLNPIASEALKDAESDDDGLRNRAWEKIDEQMRDVERPFRNALADRRLIPMVVGPDGAAREIVDDANGRESWREPAFGMPGFEATTHPITSPGPEEDRPIFVEKASFIRWFADQGVSVTEQELREYTLGSVEAESEQISDSPTAQKKDLRETNPLEK